MSDIAAVVGTGVGGVGRLESSSESIVRPAAQAPGRIERPSDRVELSDRARLLSKLANMPAIRQDLVDRVRQEIAGGNYDTPDRVEGALNNLIDDLDPSA